MRPQQRPRGPLGARRPLRPGLALRRRPRLWWAAVIVVALASGWATSSIVGHAEATRASWGRVQRVLVARHDLAAGSILRPADVELVDRPLALVPAAALRALPAGAVARAPIVAGEVIVSPRVAPAGSSAIAARLPKGTRAIAIPTEPGRVPPLEVGDLVDVVVAVAPDAAGDGPPGFVVASDAEVVAVSDVAVTIAVSRDAAPRIAVALGMGAVTLALLGAET